MKFKIVRNESHVTSIEVQSLFKVPEIGRNLGTQSILKIDIQ